MSTIAGPVHATDEADFNRQRPVPDNLVPDLTGVNAFAADKLASGILRRYAPWAAEHALALGGEVWSPRVLKAARDAQRYLPEPVLCFATIGALAPRLARRIGEDRVAWLGLATMGGEEAGDGLAEVQCRPDLLEDRAEAAHRWSEAEPGADDRDDGDTSSPNHPSTIDSYF